MATDPLFSILFTVLSGMTALLVALLGWGLATFRKETRDAVTEISTVVSQLRTDVAVIKAVQSERNEFLNVVKQLLPPQS